MKKRNTHVFTTGIVCNRLSLRNFVSKQGPFRFYKDPEQMKWETQQALLRVLLALVLILHQLSRLLEKDPYLISALLLLLLWIIRWLLKQILSQTKC